MANYNIVIGSKFRPFSYAEMLAPVAQSTEAHQKVEEGYANLSAQADMIAGLAAMEPDSEAARRYKAYSDSLYEKADRLARNGLTPQDRSDMLSMYSRYAKEIKPIETAIKMREADITRQDTLYDKGNGKIRFDREARDVSIDEYLDGKRPKYTSLNLDSIRQEVAANTQAWSKRYFSTEEGQRFNGEYYKLVQNQGISPDRAQAILLGDLSEYPELQKLIASEKGIVNYSGFSKNTQAEVDNAISQGLNMGMFFDRKETNPENWKYKTDLTFERQLQRDAIQHSYDMEKEAAKNTDGASLNYRLIPGDEVGDVDIDELNSDQKFIEMLQKQGGIKSRPVSAYVQAGIGGPDIHMPGGVGAKHYDAQNEDRARYVRLAKKYGADVKGYGPSGVQTILNGIARDREKAIVNKNTYKMNITDSSLIAQVLSEDFNTWASRGNKNVGLKDSKTGKYLDSKEVSKIMTKGKQFSLDYNPSKGFVLNYVSEDGKYKDVIIDPRILGQTTNGPYGDIHKIIQNQIENGDYDSAAFNIDGMMNELYYKFNTLSLKQSNSSSDIE